ncbi:hypothetical protein PAXRUDRAFT_595992 [Paxillus rubicundulus Ve08.2h10]|uniref:Uncharacterized protein n=1 Tax=Paxillus rubicundulus Ve08.2h10 TaxID=930991 RepID=A0A0D0DLC5_9AGAM|nr:hypothetical protein PAXRUDRAFT_595992 [Paxillus rubicundulus Ve08.2h10]
MVFPTGKHVYSLVHSGDCPLCLQYFSQPSWFLQYNLHRIRLVVGYPALRSKNYCLPVYSLYLESRTSFRTLMQTLPHVIPHCASKDAFLHWSTHSPRVGKLKSFTTNDGTQEFGSILHKSCILVCFESAQGA